jgi:light-regulated signal transduction histidine kinase (bacteriophytochrome)
VVSFRCLRAAGFPLARLAEHKPFREGDLTANLIGNSIRQTPAGSRIEVKSARDDTGGRLIVADDSPGVPTSERDRLFERRARQWPRTEDRRRSGGNAQRFLSRHESHKVLAAQGRWRRQARLNTTNP